MRFKNFLKVFSRDGESSSSSSATTINHNMVPNSTPVNTELIGAEIGSGLHLENGILNSDVESVVTQSSLNINVENADNRIYHLTQGGYITMEIPDISADRVLTFEVIVDFDASTDLNFSATIGGNQIDPIWLDSPDFAQGAGTYCCAFRYYAPIGLIGNLYWKKDEESSSSSAELAK